jgi:acetyl-CoA acetyltransferase
MNPKARYQIETPLEEVMNAEMISYPNTKLMCSANVDGSAAAVLMSEKKVKERGLMSQAVKIRASALTTDPWTDRDEIMPDVNTCTRNAAAATRPLRLMRWPVSAPRISTSSSSMIASLPPRSSTTRTSDSAVTERPAS